MTDYSELIKALRCENAQNVAGPDCAEYDCYANRGKGLYCQTAKLLSDAADAIEALQAQLPKRGEWKTTRPDAPMFGFYYCSICGRRRTSPQDNYCPNCGAKMEVQE